MPIFQSIFVILQGKDDFAEIFKNLDTHLKIILLNHSNNCV